MAKKKNKKPGFVYRKPTIAGLRLCVWCPGIDSPWYVVYAPFWYDNRTEKAMAPRWNDGYTKMYDEFVFATSEEANDFKNSIPAAKHKIEFEGIDHDD